MDFPTVCLFVFLGSIALVFVGAIGYGIYYLINTIGVKLEVGEAVVVNHNYEPPHTIYVPVGKIMMPQHVDAEWYLLLELKGEQDWIGVTKGTYRHKNGDVLKIWFGRGRLNSKMFVHNFYNEPTPKG